MTESFNVLSSRRSYEFAVDDIRLTLLSNAGVLQHVQNQFSFAVANVATPLDFFGPVGSTIPPGLVFNYGQSPFEGSSGIAIRFLHVEQRRVVIDVAGPSSALDSIFNVFKDMFSELTAPDGSPAIGVPVEVKDFSEISFKLPVMSEALLSPQLRSLLIDAVAPTMADRATIAASVLLQLVPGGDEYPGLSVRDHKSARIEVRAGSSPRDRIFFSSAPIDSDTHIRLLVSLESALTSEE